MDTLTFDAGFDKALDEAKAQSQDQAPEPTKEAEAAPQSPNPVEEKAAEPAQQAEGSEELLPQAEYDKLRQDPEALRKALNKAFTTKTQALAEERKQIEAYRELIEAFTTDPKGTVRALAERVGLDIGQVETRREVKEATNELVAELKESFGPDLEFLADKLAPALERVIERKAAEATAKEVEPLKQQTQKMQEETVKQQIDANLEAFSKKHPDWKKYEADMTKLSRMFQPAPSKDGQAPTWMEYMENLYYLATKDTREAEIAQKTVERMRESAKKSEPTDGGVSSQKVAKAAPKFDNFNAAFDDAFKAAKAGILYE